MTIFFDRVKEFAGSTGTGPFSLPGTAIVPGFRGFAASMVTDDAPYYCARQGTNWEIGVGTWDDTAEELSRNPLVSSSGVLPFDFALAPVVYTVIDASLMNQIFLYFSALVQILGTVGFDDFGNLTHNGAIADASTQYIDVTTGFNEQIPDNTSAYLLRGTATMATGALKMPEVPIPNQQMYINCNQIVTALTHTAGTGHTIENPLTTTDGIHGAIYTFRESTSMWVRLT